MSLITKNNYEAFLLDYVEGNLSPEHTAELMLFFENNPELKEDLEGFDLLTLDVPETNLENKEVLKINENRITALTFDDYAIAEIEGLNSEEKSAAFYVFLKQNPIYQKEFEVYKKSKLIAPALVFEDKPVLKREQKVIPLYWWVTSAAAVILALFLLNGINWNDEETIPIIANEIENNIVKEESLNNLENVVKESLIAEEIEVVEKVEDVKNERIIQPKKPQPIIVKEEEPEVILANEIIPEIIKDSISNQLNNPKEEIVNEEEVLLASSDNVKIVYEEDEVEDNSSQNINTKKPSKFDAVRAVIKQQVREKFLDKVKDETAVALNDGPFSFLKGKK
ncbi:MAG: hypothetical protein P1U41_08865 [Vicingaceae bacterium]|nr:hypothetical protein [Vicingaceae bacterium]